MALAKAASAAQAKAYRHTHRAYNSWHGRWRRRIEKQHRRRRSESGAKIGIISESNRQHLAWRQWQYRKQYFCGENAGISMAAWQTVMIWQLKSGVAYRNQRWRHEKLAYHLAAWRSRNNGNHQSRNIENGESSSRIK
jgi:hypothetical protein